MESLHTLSRRERQVMDALYHLEKATVSDVLERLPEKATYSAVRATLRTLSEKGHVTYHHDGPRYVYMPRVPQDKAKTAAVSHLVGTFFNGSMEAAVMALIQMSDAKVSKSEIERLRAKIRQAKQEGR